MPKIVAAAVKITPVGEDYSQIVCGKRHCDCYEKIFKQQIQYDRNTCVEGFMTHQDQFVDRYEARYMALDWGQLTDLTLEGSPLYSEELW